MDHEEAKPLLSDYVMGELSSEEAAALEGHTSACQECREILVSMGIVRQELQMHGPVVFEPHPDAESLVNYALEEQSLTTEELATIGVHVRACPDCREEVDITRRAHARTQKWWRKLVSPSMVPSFRTTPAFQFAAVALVVVLAYPAYRGLVQGPAESAQSGLGGIPNLLFDEGTRGSTGGDGTLTISLQPSQVHLSLLLPMPQPFEEIPRMIEATITRLADGEPVFHHVGPAADSYVSGFRIARANLLVPQSVLTSGKFRIKLHEAGRTDGADFYEFEVVGP